MQNNDVFQWYIVTTVGGKEALVQENLLNKIRTFGFQDKVKEIKIVYETETTVELFTPEEAPKRMVNTEKVKWETITDKTGVKYKRTKTEVKNKYPGYIFINMVLVDDLWFVIRNTQLVTGIVGSSGKNSKPTPIGELEVEKLFQTENSQEQSEPQEKQLYKAHFNIGDHVKIISGALEGSVGVVKAINEGKGTASVSTEMLGQTSVFDNVDFEDIEVIKEAQDD